MIDLALQKQLHTANGDMQLQLSVQLNRGEFVSLYGASGAGKTSVLRMLAGFLKPDDGYIKMDGLYLYNAAKHIFVHPQQRKIGFVFQDYALFPNMNVRQNITFALPKGEPVAMVDELLQLTGLSQLAQRKIDTLSGGQKQRLALARAIATKPALLLLDEPLSAIDDALRKQLQDTLLAIHRRFGLTTILVSHDMEEIMKLSNRIIHLEHGRVQASVAPAQFFNRLQGEAAALTGSVVALENSGVDGKAIVLLNNRLLTINTQGQEGDLTVGDTVQIVYEEAVPQLQKMVRPPAIEISK